MTSLPVDWYLARASGVVAYVLLTGGVLVGLTLSGHLQLRTWPKFAVTDLHRFVGLLTGVFVGLHVLTIALDTYTRFSVTQLIVPLTAGYRPLWVALGTVAAELLVALAITNGLRSRIPYRLWRRLHYASFLVWAGATAHGIGAGTDSTAQWLAAIYLVAVTSVLAALAWRLGRRRLRRAAAVRLAVLAGTGGIAAVLVLGTLPHGSAARARTPVGAPTVALQEPFSGSITQQEGAAGALVSVSGQGRGTRPLTLRVDLVTPDGTSITGTSLQVLDVRSGTICTGTVTTIDGTGFRGACRFDRGGARAVAGSWRILDRNAVSGQIELSS